MEFKKLDTAEHTRLRTALLNNEQRGGALLMNHETSFVGETTDINDELTDEEVINAVKSVPCHY